jgi:chemotaxis protein methyltransferase WspC
MSALERIGDLLRAAHLDSALTSPEAIRSIVSERRRATGIASDDAYADLAARSSAEFGKLREQIAVPETWLFRYPSSFETLRAQFMRQARRPVRVLSVACATGAEPFSIAATALAAGVHPDDIHILAIDPNPDALARARAGDLGRMAARGEIPDWAQQYVTVLPNNVRVAPEARACVDLREGSAPAALFELERGSFDAVFCRNLAIYLSDTGRRAIGEQLDALLHPDGILYLGHAERPALFGLESGFESVQGGQPGAFAFARRSVATPAVNSPPPVQTDRWADRDRAPLPPTSPARPSATAAPKSPSSNAAAARTPASVTSNEPTESKMLQSARAAADAGDLRQAADIAERIHSTGDRSLALMELLGAVHLGLGDVIRAESAWRQVVYLDPQNVEALLHLAILADRRGDAALAQRYRLRAAKGTS